MVTKMRILITGGAGYIGSHVVKALGKLGHDLVIYDNLSAGHASAVSYGRLVVADLADKALLDLVVREFSPDAVIHFNATIQVEEQVYERPAYYRDNVGITMNLLESMLKYGVRPLLLSSSAAVYGTPETIPVPETAPFAPVNSYGTLKVMLEKILRGLAEAEEFPYVSLRYFNVAGADPDGELGQTHGSATHLITRALKTARGRTPKLSIYGDDYPTPDGTCVRDYIHVDDLASAHVLALEYLNARGEKRILNCGYGHGFTVHEVINTVKRVTGIDFKTRKAARRAGDSPSLISDSSLLKKELSWKPRYDDLEVIIRTAWQWEQRYHPH